MEKTHVDEIVFVNKFLYSVQKHRVSMNNWIKQKERDGIEVSGKIRRLFKEMEEQENDAVDILRDIVKDTKLWDEFFDRINGVGVMLASSLIANIMDAGRFQTISKLWAYGGLIAEYTLAECENGHKMMMASAHSRLYNKKGEGRHKNGEPLYEKKCCPIYSMEETEENGERKPCGAELKILEVVKSKAPKRKKGYHYLFNTGFKTLCWQISEQLIKKTNPFYRDIYVKEKAKQEAQHPDLSKLHRHTRAKRKVVKIFLFHLWECWRTMEGLPVRVPYSIEKMGHTGFVCWGDLRDIIDREREEKELSKKKRKKTKVKAGV